MSLPKIDSTISPLGDNPRRGFHQWLQSILQYLVTNNPEADQHDDIEFSLGVGSFTNALPFSVFESECIRINRPLPHIQSTRSLPVIPGELVNDKKRRQQFHGDAQSRISSCFELTLQTLSTSIRQDILETHPATFAAVVS